MSKKPYDFLMSEKEPFQYIEKAKIVLEDGFLVALCGKSGKKIIPPSSLMFLMLGAGTSITQEAAIFCSLNDLVVCFSKGGSNIHSIWMSGRFQNPISLKNQIFNIEKYRLEYAKALFIFRLKLLGTASLKQIEEVNTLNNVNEILLYEARWAKKVYKEYANKYGINFTRNTEAIATDYVNERLNILNNALYSIVTAICIAISLSPSVAILHGESRRGGLAFDLADLIKTKVVFDLAFDNTPITTQKLMHKFANKLKENNQSLLKMLIRICLDLASDESNLSELLMMDIE